MYEYRVRETGEVITDLQRAFPNVSIALPVVASDLDALGVDPIMQSPQPQITRFQSVIRTGLVQDEFNNWMWDYAVVDWDQEAIDAATLKQWEVVRSERNVKLIDSDWTQLKDVQLSPEKELEWTTYRQALRDITSQSDPFEIVWPTKPE